MSTYLIFLGIAVLVGIMIKPLYGVLIALATLAYAVWVNIPNFYFLKGNKAYAANDYDGAYAYYKKGYDTGRAKFDKKVMYSSLLTRIGKPDEALDILNPLLMNKYLKPEQRNLAKQYRCMANYRKGDIDEALEEAEEMYSDGFKNTFLYSMIGFFRTLKGDCSDELLAFCKEAYEYNNDERDITDNLATVYIMRGEYDAAKEYAEKTVEKFPQFIEGRYHAAIVYHNLGDDREAAKQLDAVAQCTRTPMTTISEDMIDKLRAELKI